MRYKGLSGPLTGAGLAVLYQYHLITVKGAIICFILAFISFADGLFE